MSRRNRMIVRKVRNIVILLMAIIVMVGAYKNIRDSRAEDVIEIDVIAIDNYGYLSNELFKLEATQIDEGIYEVELPESVNGKEVNQIVNVTLEEPVPEVEIESGVQENASTENTTENTVETEVDEQEAGEEATLPETTPETTVEIPEVDEPSEDVLSSTEEDTPEVDVPEEETPPTEEETPDSTQNPTEPTVENTLEIIDNKITLTKEQIDDKQLNIEIVYNVAILETSEQGEISKNVLTEKTEEERQEIEITEETQMLYSKILKYEDVENQKLVEVRGFLPKDAELKVEEVTQEQLTEIFGEAQIDVAYDIKIVIHVTKEVLIDETDPTKGTTEIIETIEVNPEEFGESCEVSIKDIKIKTESQVYHVKEDNTFEQVNIKENTEESITFEAETFSIYAVSADEQIMLTGAMGTNINSGSFYYRLDRDGVASNWYNTTTCHLMVGSRDNTTLITEANAKFSWKTTATAGGSDEYESWTGIGDNNTSVMFTYTSSASREGTYYLGYTITAKNANGETLSINDYAGPFYIDNKAPSAPTYSAYYADDNSPYNGEWTNRQVKTKLTSTDSGSGVSYFQYKKTDGSWTKATSGGSSVSKSGTTYTYNEPWTLEDRNDTYTFRAVDGLDHKSSASSSFTIKYDLTAPTKPTITAKNADGTTYTSGSWTKQNVVLTPSATDAGSGVAKYQYSTNGSTWYDMTNASLTFSDETDGTTVYFRAIDALGYVSESSSIVIKIDKTAPSFTSAEIKNVSNTGYDVYVYGVSDDRSGINRVQFPTWTEVNGQDDLGWGGNWTTASTNSGTNMGNGTWYYRVNAIDHNNEEGWYNTHIYVYDNAGNQFNGTTLIVGDDDDHGKVYIDRTPPQITIDTDNGIIQDGLIRHYDAVNNTGSGHSNTTTTWKDLSGNYDGTVNGATFTNSNLSFDGVDDWVNAGQVSLTNAVTLQTTAQFNSITDRLHIIGNWESGGCGLYIEGGKPTLEVYISGIGYKQATWNQVLQAGVKYDITGTYDGATLKLYINGELKAETSITGTIGAPDKDTVMAIGANPGGNEASQYANEKIYNAKVYTRALTGYEVYKTAYDAGLVEETETSPDEIQTWKKEHTVTVTLSDDYSGLASGASVKYGWSTSTTTAPTSYTTATLSYTTGAMATTFEATGSGLTGKYYLWVVPETLNDLHANSQNAIAISSDTYWFDNTAPTITFDPQQNETWAKSQSVTVNIGDSHSGLATGAQVQYQWVAQGGTPSSTGWTTKTISGYNEGANSVAFSVTNSTLTGKYKLYVKVQTLKDISAIGGNALETGEIMTSDGYFWLDNTKPTLNVTSTGNDTWAKSHTATVTIGDAHSGLASGMSLQYGWSTENGSAPTSWTTATISSYSAGATSTTFTATGSGFTGKYYLWVKPATVRDVAGNALTTSAERIDKLFYFDNTKPMIEIDPTEESTPSVVTDGLIRHYNASNNTGGGYDETSTVWADLTGNHNIILPNPNATLYGDVDGDGVVTEDDAFYLLYHVMGMEDVYPLTEETRLNADVNLDGILNEDDAIMIQQYVEGTATLPEPGTIFENEYLYIENRRIKHRRI